MAVVTMTAKRQVTFPKEACEELQVQPGDQMLVERRVVDGETVWVIRPRTVDWSWIGSVRVREDVPHDMDSIRASIARGRKRSAR